MDKQTKKAGPLLSVMARFGTQNATRTTFALIVVVAVNVVIASASVVRIRTKAFGRTSIHFSVTAIGAFRSAFRR